MAEERYIPSPKGRQGIYLEVTHERMRQDAEWGGPEHDDHHDIRDWHDLIGRQTHLLRETQYAPHGPEARRRLVKIAALAVAALESIDRRADAAGEISPARG